MAFHHSKDLTIRSIIKALGLTSSATLIAILISALTNKVLSLVTGPEGIGLMGVFRNLASLLGGVLTLGYTTLLAQQVSKARTEEEKSLVTQAAFLLFFFQGVIGFIVLMFFSQLIEKLLFPNAQNTTHTFQVRIVILMALVNIFLQVVIAILRGQSDIRRLSLLQIATALGSLVMIYPLTQMGATGLAINVGSGSIIGGILGLIYLSHYGLLSFSLTKTKAAFSQLKNSGGASLLITFQTFSSLGGLLIVQTLVQRRLGLEALGNYNAAMLVLDTLVLVLMSAVRSYLLPMLSRCRSEDEKEAFFSRFLTIMLSLAAFGALVIWIAAPLFIRILFTDKFSEAETLLRVFGISFIGLTLVWMYNTLLLHFEKHLAFTVIDSVCMFIFVLLVNSSLSNSILSVAWCYVLVSILTGVTYVCFVTVNYGRGFLPLRFSTLREVSA